MFNQPLFSCLRAALIVVCIATAAAAEPSRPSIRESARKEVVRLVAAEASASVLPPNYPRTFAGPVPKSRFGRRIVTGTAGAVGGLFAGALLGTGIARVSGCPYECALSGMLVGAPVGMVAGAITAVVLTH
jgi:hypothetical protein